ncbi:MAG: valine--tRNA ligase [Rhizobiales bacterium]|nr:valine--tRNA ligase [Hyphomicrobiales bacterium]
MLDKTYDAASVEPRIYADWESAGAFNAGVNAKAGADPYCIVIPPPNVTGSLHMGHALNNTLQDILVRFERMRGRDVLWQVGTDHAGIATQMVVERELAKHQEPSRREMGREAFLERVWRWKAESGGTIIGQLKRLGASCDWSRERFTMDEGLSAAVLEVFVTLHREGLIYRGKRLVNWDPHFETAISDLEVENIEVDGNMWHFKYPLAGGTTYIYVEKDADGAITLQEERDYISIATTRPETMLGDGAVAVHPDDERYRPIIGMLCEIPVGPKEHRRLIPIITDEYPDPAFGSGAVKITGAHDFNDYQVAKRNDIPLYRLMDTSAAMRDDGAPYAVGARQALEIAKSGVLPGEGDVDLINLVPDEYRGLDRYEARSRIIAAINAEGLCVTTRDEAGNLVPLVEEKKIMQPFGDRSKVVVEPMLTDQWFVDAKTLAEPALSSVREGRTKFVPDAWEKTYFQWLENIEPWCISRQLWWGHRIPAWHGHDGAIFVEKTEAEAHAAAARHYGKAVTLTRDPDVLDTWFSSALWPFSTLGWPERTAALEKYYQTDVLVTGFDIIFFWVARMMMMGLHFMKEEPFHTVYIHALVRDESGAKMSKSKGNVIDPLDLVDEFSADAVRFTLAAMAAQGRDIRLSTERVAGYRNFSTKLWNAARFAEMNGCCVSPGFDPAATTLQLNRWVLTELSKTVAAITREIEAYRFNDAAASAYRFVWNTFCDWHLELAKPVFSGEDEAAKAEVRQTTAYVLEEILKILHPFMPFVTEELWSRTTQAESRGGFLMHAAWPLPGLVDAAAADDINWLIDLVQAIRSVRAETNVPAGAKTDLVLVDAAPLDGERLMRHEAAIARLARVEKMTTSDVAPRASAQIVLGGVTVCLPLEGVIDFGAERTRLQKEAGKCGDEISKIEKKLGNDAFVAKAPESVVAEQRARLIDLKDTLTKIEDSLSRLG